MKIEPIPI